MPDNMLISTAGGNRTVSTDQINGVDFQRVKIISGADDTNDGDVQRANASQIGPLPVNAYLASDFIMVAGLGLTPQFKLTTLTADGDLIAAVTGKQIRVLALYADEEDQTAGVEIIVRDNNVSGTILGEFSGFDLYPTTLPFCPVGWFETTSGKALFGDVTGTTPDLNIHIVYLTV